MKEPASPVPMDPPMPLETQTDTPTPLAAREADRTAVVAHSPAWLVGRPLGEILRETAGLAPDRLEEALAAQRGE